MLLTKHFHFILIKLMWLTGLCRSKHCRKQKPFLSTVNNHINIMRIYHISIKAIPETITHSQQAFTPYLLSHYNLPYKQITLEDWVSISIPSQVHFCLNAMRDNIPTLPQEYIKQWCYVRAMWPWISPYSYVKDETKHIIKSTNNHVFIEPSA